MITGVKNAPNQNGLVGSSRMSNIASIMPTKSAPASPRYMRAGFLFQKRNPKQEPQSAIAVSATELWPLENARTKMKKEAITEKPAAPPSRLSKKFSAFVTPTIQNKEII